MNYIASWGPMGFLVSPSKIVPFNDFSTSITLKTDAGNDTSGTGTTNARGLEPQQMSFATKYMRAAGVDPRERLETWNTLVGQAYPLYIGDKRFGPAKMILIGVDVSELLTNNNGDFLSVTLSITLKEETTKTTTKSYASSSNAAQNTAASKAAATYAETVAKKKAMNATASVSDRTAKKVTGSGRELVIK